MTARIVALLCGCLLAITPLGCRPDRPEPAEETQRDDEAPRRVEIRPFETDAPRSLAYRLQRRVDGQTHTATFWIDLTPGAAPELVLPEDGAATLGQRATPADVLWVPDEPLVAGTPLVRTRTVEGAGQSTSAWSADVQVHERFTLLEPDDQGRERYRVDHEMRALPAPDRHNGSHTEVTAEVVYDPRARRIISAQGHAVIHLEPPGSAHDAPTRVETDLEATLDLEASRARTAELRRADAVPAADEGSLTAWRDAHPESVLRASLEARFDTLEADATAAGTSPPNVLADPVVAFYRNARPRLLWSLLLEQPVETVRLAALAESLSARPDRDALVELALERLSDTPSPQVVALAETIVDARMRPALERIDSHTARSTLDALDVLANDSVGPLDASGGKLLARLQVLSLHPSVHPALLDALIEQRLVRAAVDPHASSVAAVETLGIINLLESLTAHPDPVDPSAWRTMRARLGPHPRAWLLEALAEGSPLMQTTAAQRLAQYPAEDATSDALAALLDDEARRPGARLAAATTLAALGDARAAPWLVEKLADADLHTRTQAFVALGHLADRPLGYDPGDDEVARAEAVARWHAWLAERP